jgi:hypothetical protein
MRTRQRKPTKERGWLRLPVVSAGAEYLAMGYLMRRNILTYKAPPNNEGYDLICIPPPNTKPSRTASKKVIRVQVKSRYATDCDRGFPVKETSFKGFDYLMIVFLNIGWFYGGYDGSEGKEPLEIYTLPQIFIKKHHIKSSTWQKVHLMGIEDRIKRYKDDDGIEQIAKELGISGPRKEH